MRRTIRPCLELLEGKTLLSGISSTTSGLVDALTAVASRSGSGVQVAETFTETNVSSHEIRVSHGPTNDGFTVSQAGKTIWSPGAEILPDFITQETLKPGQSLTIHATWDGRANEVNPAEPWVESAPLSVTFTVANALDHGASTASVIIPKSWTLTLPTTHLTPPRPAPHVHQMSGSRLRA